MVECPECHRDMTPRIDRTEHLPYCPLCGAWLRSDFKRYVKNWKGD